MADLIAIGFDDEQLAARVRAGVDRLGIAPDAAAVIIRGGDGGYAVRTEHHALPTATSWAMFWELLFAGLFFVPVLGMSTGPGLGPLIEGALAAGAGEPCFAERIREALQPGTSALFLIGEAAETGRLQDALIAFNGRMLTAPLSEAAVRELQEQLHGVGPRRVF